MPGAKDSHAVHPVHPCDFLCCAIIPSIMINKFGVLYAGCVEMDDIGYAGTPANERWLPDEQLATVFDQSASFAKTMDKLGFDTFWGAEHHFQREGYECIPNLLMLFVHLANLTKDLRFGCASTSTRCAPGPPRRGLRHRRHPHKRPRPVRHRQRLSLPRSRSFATP